MTVTEKGDNYYTADVMNVSLEKTTLKLLSKNDKVNLERAMSLNDRLGGHIVQGHVDGIGKIINVNKEPNKFEFEIEAEEKIIRLIVSGGSVALNGISLTVSDLFENSFKVSIIPTTLSETTFNDKKIGDFINIETDILGKYIDKYLNRDQKFKITEQFLIDNNF